MPAIPTEAVELAEKAVAADPKNADYYQHARESHVTERGTCRLDRGPQSQHRTPGPQRRRRLFPGDGSRPARPPAEAHEWYRKADEWTRADAAQATIELNRFREEAAVVLDVSDDRAAGVAARRERRSAENAALSGTKSASMRRKSRMRRNARRRLSLLEAVSLNMSLMVGIGPFITLPALVGTLGGPQSMIGWVLGGLVALADGMVWSELAAAFPGSGGTYHFYDAAYGGAASAGFSNSCSSGSSSSAVRSRSPPGPSAWPSISGTSFPMLSQTAWNLGSFFPGRRCRSSGGRWPRWA